MPKLSTITNASGASMITQRSGVCITCAAIPEFANKSATIPVSSTPDPIVL